MAWALASVGSVLASLRSAAVFGVDVYPVQIEVDVSFGLPHFTMVGLPDATVRESRDRVRSAIKNSGFEFPPHRITVNLAPADVRKAGSSFDLPIALGLLATSGQLTRRAVDDTLVLGELSLDGAINGIRGVLPIAIAARRLGLRRLLLPPQNTAEACVVDGLDVCVVRSLPEALEALNYPERAERVLAALPPPPSVTPSDGDLSEVWGQLLPRRALEVAAAGGHNLLLYGPPGAGKTMLVVTPADVAAGTIHNTGTGDSDQTPPDTDDEDVPMPQPSLTTDKALLSNGDADGSGDVSAGDTLTYRITVTNNGTANLTNVTVDDDLTGTVDAACAALLAPGETCTLVGTYVVTADDVTAGSITNTATASSDQTPDATDDETVPVPSGVVSMTKLTNGMSSTTTSWHFTLSGPDVSATATTPPTTFDFGGVTLISGLTYQVCESSIPAGWTAEWSVGTTIIPFVPGVNTSPVGPSGHSDVFDPNYVAPPTTYTNDTRCVNFTVEPDQTLAFEIDNSFVGGGQRTIGYWKNWSTSTGGGQVATAAANGGAEAGFFILDDLLADPGFLVGDLALGGSGGVPNADCAPAVNILNKSDAVTGEKKASDPAFNMAAQLLAAMLNEAAQSKTCAASQAAVEDGQKLLEQLKFDGTGEYPRRGTQANALAETLDLYNNGLLCP